LPHNLSGVFRLIEGVYKLTKTGKHENEEGKIVSSTKAEERERRQAGIVKIKVGSNHRFCV
jgi:hypothetical protein